MEPIDVNAIGTGLFVGELSALAFDGILENT